MSEHILVVDDDRDTADSLAKLIGAMGYQVKAVYDGAAAVKEAASFQPDMALIDLGMPGLDGFKTVSLIRQQREAAHVILVAITGMSGDEAKRRAYESGFDLHVVKPVSEAKLRELLSLLDPAAEARAGAGDR
jgi:CheY-like chemotaxis protein